MVREGGWFVPRDIVFEDGGLRVSERRYGQTLPLSRGLDVEVLVIGGDWLLSELEARELRDAITEWLEASGAAYMV